MPFFVVVLSIYTPLLESDVYSTEYKSDGQFDAAGQEPLFIVKCFLFCFNFIKCACAHM